MSEDDVQTTDWLTTAEVAPRLKVKVKTIREYCQRGLLRYQVSPYGHQHYLIDPKSVDEFQERFHGKPADAVKYPEQHDAAD